jgi:hypothetical protein
MHFWQVVHRLVIEKGSKNMHFNLKRSRQVEFHITFSKKLENSRIQQKGLFEISYKSLGNCCCYFFLRLAHFLSDPWTNRL